jgi:membrane peptidoglycan carboxypeptidase
VLSRQRLESIILRRPSPPDPPATRTVDSGIGATPSVATPAKRCRIARSYKLLITVVPAIAILAAATHELKTSAMQARLYARYVSGVSFTLSSGRSPETVFPDTGPLDRTRGYTDIPRFIDRLAAIGYHITEQARVSARFRQLMKWGIQPPYEEPAEAGLEIRAEDGQLLYRSDFGQRLFHTFEDIPPIIIKSLLFIENRELEFARTSTANPAIEWDRLGWAGILYAGRKAGLPLPVEGGSTLAVQLEKYRHSPQGRTGSASEKLRQIVSATLRAYKSGPDTLTERKNIILDYLNTLPLAAQVSYGEVNGLGEGLYAWFGQDLGRTVELLSSRSLTERASALKHVLALLCSVRAPSYYLISNRDALEVRIRAYAGLMQLHGVLDAPLANAVRATPLLFLERAPVLSRAPYPSRKHIDSTRVYLQNALGVAGLYDLDRLHLEADTPIDAGLQSQILDLLTRLHDPEFVEKNGLRAERLLITGDPRSVIYSMTLFERTPEGNLLRAQADTLDGPFDLNTGMKMELGSTAKLRTIAHYLDIVDSLYRQMKNLAPHDLVSLSRTARDPITAWAVQTLQQNPAIELDAFLGVALDRKYSSGTGEVFFTGGGAHTFNNFDSKDDGQLLPLKEAFRRSTNLVFIRLMRDLVRYHQARLAYDADMVLKDTDYAPRAQLLEKAADAESTQILFRAFQSFRHLNEDELITRILGSRNRSLRHLSMLFFAWNHTGTAEDLHHWLEPRVGAVSLPEAEKLLHSYDPARLNLLDYGYLLSRHPLEVWCGNELSKNPNMSWNELFSRSAEARGEVSTWLFKVKNRKPQDIRLRIRIEQDAFERMTPDWQRFAFPFEKLVPSLATAIGSSSDRPIALAELMGIILNDGVRRPAIRANRFRIAARTPYETVLEPSADHETRVMSPEVARTLRELLATIVEGGTAQRLAGAFALPDGTRIVAGGKTGSGDNRYETSSHGGPINRTATFVFYIGNKYFGVVTAHVNGRSASQYHFTSALPVTVVKMLAPALNSRLAQKTAGQKNVMTTVSQFTVQ